VAGLLPYLVQRLLPRPEQDAARDFYVNKLGFEVSMDGKKDNGFRWLTDSPKGQPDLQIILMKVDGPNMQPEVA